MLNDPSKLDLAGVSQREKALKIASAQIEQTATAQNVQLLIQIVANRAVMVGDCGSAKSASIVEAADKLLLKWINGLQGIEERDDE